MWQSVWVVHRVSVWVPWELCAAFGKLVVSRMEVTNAARQKWFK